MRRRKKGSERDENECAQRCSLGPPLLFKAVRGNNLLAFDNRASIALPRNFRKG